MFLLTRSFSQNKNIRKNSVLQWSINFFIIDSIGVLGLFNSRITLGLKKQISIWLIKFSFIKFLSFPFLLEKYLLILPFRITIKSVGSISLLIFGYTWERRGQHALIKNHFNFVAIRIRFRLAHFCIASVALVCSGLTNYCCLE